jgi:hypothetical protein
VVLRGIGVVGVLAGLGACVVEREPAPKRPLLRDVLAAHPPAPDTTVVAVAPTVAIPLDAQEVVGSFDAPPVPDAFRTCETDGDCAAVLRNGCCHDGRNEAVNKASVDAYKASFTCPNPHLRCPMHMVLDRREPACDRAAHQCTLVMPPPTPAAP